MTTSKVIAPLLQYFFTEHLCAHKQVSPRTTISYRDSFRLLLRFLQTRTGREPSALTVSDLDAPAILAFLESLEAERSNAVCSRNAGLSAVRSFFRVAALRDNASVGIVTRVMAIPVKRTEKRLVGHLTGPEMTPWWPPPTKRLVRATGPRVAADDVQQRGTRIRGHQLTT